MQTLAMNIAGEPLWHILLLLVMAVSGGVCGSLFNDWRHRHYSADSDGGGTDNRKDS